MIRPFFALPFLALAWLCLFFGEGFNDLAQWIDHDPCAGCGGTH